MTFQQNFSHHNHISCLWPELHEVEEDGGGIIAEQEGCQQWLKNNKTINTTALQKKKKLQTKRIEM